ncbi:MAG: proton-conducting transporter membrane subunit [Hyphomonadaceae bacterium]
MTPEMMIIAALGIPLAVAVGIFLTGRVPDIREGVTLIGAVALFIVAILLVREVAAGGVPELVLGDAIPGMTFAFKVEPLGALFALVGSGLWIINSFYSIGYMRGHRERNQTRFYMCFALALFGVMGIALAANLFTLFVFYEILTLSTYPLVTHKGDEAARRGGRIYLLTLMGTSMGLFLVAVIWTSSVAGSLDFVPGGLLAGKVGPGVASVLLLLFVFGIGKAALMPFHFWLPNAMVAPTPVSALLHAVAVVKAGVFTVLKVSIYIFGPDLLSATPATDWVLGIGCATILIASLIAMTKDNLKARLAYSTVSQLAYITVGAMLATSAGFMGGGLQIAAHAMAKITLFMCAGAIYVATGLTNISDMRGLGKKMPWVFGAFLVAAMSIIGLPPFAGGWVKYELMLGAAEASRHYVVWVLIASSILNIAYLLPIPFLALMPPKGTPEPAPYKRAEGAPFFTVAAPVITAFGTLVLFFLMGSLAKFLEPIMGGLT